MMTQGELAFKFEEERQGEGITGMTGIGPYRDLASRSGPIRSLELYVKAGHGEQGWTDVETAFSLIMLNLVGGECAQDVNRLESDKMTIPNALIPLVAGGPTTSPGPTPTRFKLDRGFGSVHLG